MNRTVPTAHMINVYEVEADRQTGEWIGTPEHVGAESLSDWNARVDTDDEHYDTYEVNGETRAIAVKWVD